MEFKIKEKTLEIEKFKTKMEIFEKQNKKVIGKGQVRWDVGKGLFNEHSRYEFL